MDCLAPFIVFRGHDTQVCIQRSRYTGMYLNAKLVRKDMDVYELERLSNFTLGHKLKYMNCL